MRTNTGFTLIELVVTIAIAAIVLTIGVPSFQETINNNRLTSGANEFVTGLNLARSEAIKRSVTVTLCKSADGATCAAGGGYEQGWIVFVDPNGNAAVDGGEQVVRAYGALSGGMTLTAAAPVANAISYTASGVVQLAGACPVDGAGFAQCTLNLCKPNYATSARQLVLGVGGRVRVQRAEPASAAGC